MYLQLDKYLFENVIDCELKDQANYNLYLIDKGKRTRNNNGFQAEILYLFVRNKFYKWTNEVKYLNTIFHIWPNEDQTSELCFAWCLQTDEIHIKKLST